MNFLNWNCHQVNLLSAISDEEIVIQQKFNRQPDSMFRPSQLASLPTMSDSDMVVVSVSYLEPCIDGQEGSLSSARLRYQTIIRSFNQ